MGFIIYIILLVIIAIVSCVGFFVLNKQNQVLSGKKAIFYYLAFSVVILLGGFIALLPSAATSMMYFLLLQVVYLGLGYLASIAFRKNVLGEFNSGTTSGIFFILGNAILGMIGFTIVYHYFAPPANTAVDSLGLAPYYALSVIPFVVPYFLSTAFARYRAIPQEIFKVWYFPMHADEIDFENIDTSTIFMLELEYSKSVGDPRLINTKLRAPVAMNFGDWFRSFIENYNFKYDSDPIHFLQEDQSPQGWMFYVKPSFLGTAKFIDPDLSIAQNKIIEKNIIIAKRVGIVEEEPAQQL